MGLREHGGDERPHAPRAQAPHVGPQRRAGQPRAVGDVRGLRPLLKPAPPAELPGEEGDGGEGPEEAGQAADDGAGERCVPVVSRGSQW